MCLAAYPEQLEKWRAGYKMDPYKISIIIGLALATLEMLASALIFIGFSIGMLLVAVAEFIFNGFDPQRDILIFVTGSAASIAAMRTIVKRKSDMVKLVEDDINQY
jgi:membrane protein implicated in regulation of membrane protease activity